MRVASGNNIEVMMPNGVMTRGDEIIGTTDGCVDIIMKAPQHIFIIENFMNDDLAKILSGLTTIKAANSTYFISDVRTNMENEDYVSEIDVLWNSAMVYNWLTLLKPSKYMLKFRCPWIVSVAAQERALGQVRDYHKEAFAACPIDMLGNLQRGEFHYMPGDIYLQQYAPSSSAETRLIGSSLDVVKYDITEYEEKLSYYNNVVRASSTDISDQYCNAGDDGPRSDRCSKLCVDHCMDCSNMIRIFENYNKKYNADIDVIGSIDTLLKQINRNICCNSHGKI
jgi:hypothetical protein